MEYYTYYLCCTEGSPTYPKQLRRSQHGDYTIISYDPEILSFDNEDARFYTSVVVDACQQKVVACSMAKPGDLSLEQTMNDEPGNTFHFEEMIEGTTINLFYTGTKWEIATRNAIGGKYWFYRTQYGERAPRQTTFLEMFVEALGYEKTTPLNEIAFLSELDMQYSYSFILQHPDNHIVQTFAFPHLFLVGVYKITGQTELTRVDSYPLSEFSRWKAFQNATMPVEFPRSWEIRFDEVAYEKQKAEILAKCPMGIFLVSDKTGLRAVIENPDYARLKELRGNNPNLQYQFLCMYYIGKVNEFIETFPMYKNQFHRFMKQYRDFVSQVQDAYYKYYVCKLRDEIIPKRFFIHAAAIHHAVYIPSIKPYSETGKIVITKTVVDDYFKKMGPQKLIYYLNLEDTNTNK